MSRSGITGDSRPIAHPLLQGVGGGWLTHPKHLQLLPLTRKITGRVKLSPSSAISGGGAGTGSERLTMASAASSNALSPDPLSMLVESTWPVLSSVNRT